MLSNRFMPAIFFGILILVLAGCSAGLPAPLVPPIPAVSPLPATEPTSMPPAQTSPLATPTAAAAALATVAPPSAGKASVAGRLIDFKTGKPMVSQSLSLPSVVCPTGVTKENVREQCVYMIDTAFDPSVLTDQEGRFVFRDIASGRYVLLVGNPETSRYTVLADESKKPFIWEVEADKVTELGDLVVELP
ncbi:MAG: hypothetical protein ACM30E_09860 [Nitrososphaerales archaeon]